METTGLPMPPREWLRTQIEACLDYEGIGGDLQLLAGRIADHILNNWHMAYLARELGGGGAAEPSQG